MTLLESKNPNRHPVDVLRVRYWFQGVLKALDCQTAYQLEKLLEPEHFRRQHQRTVYPSKWNRYGAGENTPQIRLVRKVDGHAAGSARELNHPLWAILKTMGRKTVSMADWIGRLDPGVQSIMLQARHDCFGAPRELAPFNRRQGNRLLRRGDLDALAALVLYWIEADRQDNAEQMREVAGMIYHLLLIVGLDFHKRNLGAELLLLFTARIFDLTPWAGGHFGVDAKSFDISLLILHHMTHPADDPVRTPRWRERVGRMLKLLAGNKGFDVMFAMRPFCLPAWEAGPPTLSEWASWETDRRYWAWGWDCIFKGVQGKFPPDEAEVPGRYLYRERVRASSLSLPLRRDTASFLGTCAIFEYGQWPPAQY